MERIPVTDAVGMVLGHDITEIVPGRCKCAAFKKGYIITKNDIPKLLDIGKRHIFVLDLGSDMIHEDDAARRMAEAARGPGIILTEPHEGKIEFIAAEKGLLKVNARALESINLREGLMFASLHSGQIVEKGQKLGGTRIIPLAIEKKTVETAERICRRLKPVITVKPLKPRNIGVVTTGSEVYHGRIEDKFGPVLERKFGALGCRIIRQVIVDDDMDMIAGAIRGLIAEGADFIAATGGMSVDPDDVTPSGIRAAGGTIATHGAPALPGAMFLLADIQGIPVVGLPACIMYVSTSIFELVVPRLLAGDTVTRTDIAKLGHGGFCLACAECRYPRCGFGKAV